MKLNFNIPVINLDDTPLKDQNDKDLVAGKILANALVMQPQGEIAKLFDWAIAMHRGETIDLDRADQQKLREFIQGSQMVILVKKALLDVLDRPAPSDNGQTKENIPAVTLGKKK